MCPFNPDLTVIDIKNFPFFGTIMESFGEKHAKRCLTEFSGVWAYTPMMEFSAVWAYNPGKAGGAADDSAAPPALRVSNSVAIKDSLSRPVR